MKKIDLERRMDDTKLPWHIGRIRELEQGKRVAPIHIDMGIAKFCNINCTFCYGLYQNPMKKLIQREVLLQTLRDAKDIGVKSIGFIGDGEPTCNPHVYEALTLGKQLGIDMALSTNGVLLDNDEKRKTVLDSCVWMRFCFSAGTRDGYKKVHRKDYFDKVVKNIKRLVELKKEFGYKCDIGLQAVFDPSTMLEDMKFESKLAVELGVDYLVIKQCSLPDDGSSGMTHFDVNMYDSKEVLETLKYCESLSNEKTKIIPKWNLMEKKGTKNYKNCPSIPLISEISGNGDWYPCGFMFGEKDIFKKYKFGNLHEQSLKQIWESEKYWEIVKEMNSNFNVQEQCKGCCRQDKCNEWLFNYYKKEEAVLESLKLAETYEPLGVNFI